MSIGGDSRLILEDLCSLAAMYDVAGLDAYPRSVVNLEPIVDAPSDEDVRGLVGSGREEAVMERRRRNLVVNRGPSFSSLGLIINWTCLPRGLLSRATEAATRA